MAITDLAGAIEEYRTSAVNSYNAAQHRLSTHPDDKNAQEKLQAAISQLMTAEAMRAAQQGRDGYADVVKLMLTTATTASVIAVKIGEITASLSVTGTNLTQELDMIRVLSGALQAVAQLSPASVWQKPAAEE